MWSTNERALWSTDKRVRARSPANAHVRVYRSSIRSFLKGKVANESVVYLKSIFTIEEAI